MKCEECKYWEFHDYSIELTDESRGKVGWCLRFPPIFRNDRDPGMEADEWPNTLAIHWCGEFEAKGA